MQITVTRADVLSSGISSELVINDHITSIRIADNVQRLFIRVHALTPAVPAFWDGDMCSVTNAEMERRVD
jgi:hypothetical protein